MCGPAAVAPVFHALLGSESVEVCGLLCLTTKMQVIAYHELSRGTLDRSCVHPREVFKTALLANAAGIVLGHNHPSGDPTPSPDDRALTKRLVEAGSIIGVELLDHIIVGHADRYWSFREGGLLI
ncbi:MAG: JAB domain-containing protein [Hyphomicrobium sp.]|jgi:DNA repair protein RadC